MIELLDQQQSLTANQWKIFSSGLLALMLEFLDYFLIGYVVAVIVGPWHLTFGQSALILFASGLSAWPGSYFWGWLADRIGRRTVFIATVLNFSIATGALALTPEHSWIYLTVMRFIMGFGVGGVFTVDMPLIQEFVPTARRGLISGLSMALLPAGPAAAAALGAFLGPVIGWRGLFAIGLLPALLSLMIFAWVPESPRWLIVKRRPDEARRSLAWALGVSPDAIALPPEISEIRQAPWWELFKYPRSVVAGIFTGLAQTGAVGLFSWIIVLFVLVLKISAAEAAFLTIWINLIAIPGRIFCSWLSDAIGRRHSGGLTCLAAAVTMSLAGYLHDVYLGTASLFFILLLIQSFFGIGNYSIIGPYMAEVWPASLRASGLGLAYGTSNIGKFIGPLGLALIAGSSNFVKPAATVAALIPAFNYFAVWWVLAAIAFWFIGFETSGRSIEEIDAALTGRAPEPAPARVPTR